MFSKAIVRPPGANFATGLTTVDLGAPDLAITRGGKALKSIPAALKKRHSIPNPLPNP